MAATGEGAQNAGGDNAPASADGQFGEIDAISGATFTTNAILELVNNAYEFIKNYAGK
ncbi:MAG TPA: FMN-binding protein [Mobilitalea sp.]|nr:FMN-binding protein [Mobilitalea sp.]